MKTVKVKFPNGHKFLVPAEVIAKDRAEYYANKEVQSQSMKESVYDQEFKYTMSDSGELLDWVQNNMNWEDLSDHATLIKESEKPFDYERNWHKAKLTTDWDKLDN